MTTSIDTRALVPALTRHHENRRPGTRQHNQRTLFIAACLALLVAACSDTPQPTAPTALAPNAAALTSNSANHAEKLVSIGTSISMGWSSNGVYEGSQLFSWPALLRFGPSQGISLPLIQSPGCTSPLIAPLGANMRLSGEPFAGSTVCAPNVAGVQLPTPNVALAGSLAIDALTTTPQTAPADEPWYARVLPPGTTQVSAALGQNPTIVSVELGGNDILGTTSGLVAPGVTYVPFSLFAQAFGAVLNAVGSVEPMGLIIGLPTEGRNLPSLRRGDEVWADAAEFAALHVDVSADCANSPNYINVSVKSVILVFTGAFTSTHGLPNPVFSCADVPGTQDFVLTPTDLETLNGILGQMADLAKTQAAERGYAFASLGALYDLPDLKPPVYSVVTQLTSAFPYGPYISLDGVHPGPLGHAVISHAAAVALNKTYGRLGAHVADLPASALAARFVEPTTPSIALEWAKRIVRDHQGQKVSTCLMPGGCTLSSRKMR